MSNRIAHRGGRVKLRRTEHSVPHFDRRYSRDWHEERKLWNRIERRTSKPVAAMIVRVGLDELLRACGLGDEDEGASLGELWSNALDAHAREAETAGASRDTDGTTPLKACILVRAGSWLAWDTVSRIRRGSVAYMESI